VVVVNVYVVEVEVVNVYAAAVADRDGGQEVDWGAVYGVARGVRNLTGRREGCWLAASRTVFSSWLLVVIWACWAAAGAWDRICHDAEVVVRVAQPWTGGCCGDGGDDGNR
jgi:hypothetical protein